MNKVERLTTEILLLQERKRTSEELASILEVSRRTILRDVRALAEMGVPVVAVDGAGGGLSLPPAYTLAPLALTLKEAILLALALDGLAAMADSPYAPERASLLAKLRTVSPGRHRERVVALGQRLSIEVPKRDRHAPCLEALIEAAEGGRAVEFRYDSAEGERRVRARPERIYAARGFWYLVAAEDGRHRTFRADRIAGVTSDAAWEPEKAIAYDDPSHPTVRVRLSVRGARRVGAEEHLGRLVAGAAPQTIEFRCPPSELDWYARYFGGQGADAVVDGPSELIERIRQGAAEILEIYGER